MQVFFIRQGKLLGRDHFHMKVAEGDSKSDIISEFMKQYYGGTPLYLILLWCSTNRGCGYNSTVA